MPSALARQIKHNVEVDKLDTFHQVVLPLRTRFEVVGSLVITASNDYRRTGVWRRRSAPFSPAWLGLSAVFAIFVVFAAPYLARARAPWLQIAYAVTFLVMAGLGGRDPDRPLFRRRADQGQGLRPDAWRSV